MRREYETIKELKKFIDQEKYILIYNNPERPYLYDLLYRLDDDTWNLEIASNSNSICHNCGALLLTKTECDEPDCKITNMTEKELLDHLTEEFFDFKFRKCEVISYEEIAKFYTNYANILQDFRDIKKDGSYKGKDIKEFMESALDYIVGSEHFKFRKSIRRTIKVYSKYPLADNVYYKVSLLKYSKNFTLKRDLEKSPKKN